MIKRSDSMLKSRIFLLNHSEINNSSGNENDETDKCDSFSGGFHAIKDYLSR